MSTSTPPICEAVLWDFGNVLIGWDPYAAVAAHYTREEWDELVTRGDFHARNHRSDAGSPRSAEIAALMAEDPALGEIYRCYVENFDKGLVPELPANALVAELAEAGVPQYGLTNWSAEEIGVAPSMASGIGRLAGYVVSGEEKVAKPAPRIYEIAAERFGLRPAATLFVDDVAANCEAAAAAGFLTHHYVGKDPAAALRARLAALGLLPA